jgi:hypothetical protein
LTRFALRFEAFVLFLFRGTPVSAILPSTIAWGRGGYTPLAHLAEAYIHFKPYDAPDRRIRSLGKYAERLAIEVAGEVFGGDVRVHVELEQGSLRTRIAVYGAIALGTYGAVANYKGFKESVVAMCEDAREFAVDVCDPFTEKAGVASNDVYRFERRLKTPGKLYRITRRLEKLQRSVPELSAKDIQKELASLRGDLNLVAEDVTAIELREIENALRRPRLPPPAKWPEPQAPRVILRKEDEQELPFDGQTMLAEISPPNRRIVFQSTTEVPRRLRLKRKKDDKQISIDD